MCHIVERIFTGWQGGLFIDMSTMVNALICLLILVCADVKDEWLPKKRWWLPSWAERWRWELAVAAELIVILLFGIFDNNQFIYFQF